MPDPYGVEPEPTLPDLPGEPVVHDSAEQILDAVAAEVYLLALMCVRRFGDFHLALSSGRFQERLVRQLMIDPSVRALPWNKTHVWAISDRPDDAGASAFRSVTGLLAGQAGIPRGNLHEPEHHRSDPSREYERRLQRTLAWREKGQDRLDLALMVVEGDGSMAGFHPSDETLASDDRLVVEARSGLAMTARLLNASRLIAVVATGSEAGGRLLDDKGIRSFPKPVGGYLRWYLDREACPA
jgi:hexose-6-phosphate dehydrogenase